MDDRSAEAFREACGARGPLRVRVAAGGSEGVRVVPRPFALVGRDLQADITLDSESVSRRHALMVVIEGRAFVVDLGSRAGTLWGGAARPSGWLGVGDAVTIGPYRVGPDGPGLEAPPGPGDGPNPLASWLPGEERPPGFILEALNRRAMRMQWRVNRTLTLAGHSPECKLRLADASISSVHFCLLHTPAGLWAVDLLGRDGVQVNGQAVAFARLADGDDLRAGRFLFRVRAERPNKGREVAALAAPGPDVGQAIQALLASVGGGPGPAARRPEVAESLLIPIVNGLGLMQEHTQNQHEQTMVLLRAVCSLQGDQVREVRQDLGHVVRMLQEIRTLTQAVEQPPAPPPLPAGHTGPSGSGPQILPFPSPVDADRRGPPGSVAPPVPPEPSAEPGQALFHGAGPPAPGEPATPDEDVSALICQRLEEVRKERMNLWQKILDMVVG